MASRSSSNYNSEFYQTSWRGRPLDGDISLEMFPEKYERTQVEEDPMQVHDEMRLNLLDTTPETDSMFAYEEPRRNTFARSHLNLRDGGIFGSTTDPYVNAGGNGYGSVGGASTPNTQDGYDIQFHDKDPRYYLDEQPWNRYREVQEANMRRTDFKDDGDYSLPSGGNVHPNTLYKNIRASQNWVKDRLKIFDTSFENIHPGGVGVYPHVSDVFKSSHEDTSVLTDGTGMSTTFEDPENRQRLTMKLSNIVHGGSPILRTNETTDHKVQVAGYGMLYKQRGLLNHETQLRMTESDTPWSKIEGNQTAPKGLVKLMANALQDRGGITPRTAAHSARLIYQDAAFAGQNQEKFGGMTKSESELHNRNHILTKDIMALLGIVDQDIKFLESQTGKNRRQADRALANVYEMAQVLHRLPANVKLEMRDELLLRSAGFGLAPGSTSQLRKACDQVIVNPKIVQHMDLMVRRTVAPGDSLENRMEADGDSEGKLNRAQPELFVSKMALRSSENIDFNRREGKPEKEKFAGKSEARVASYRNLARSAEKVRKNSGHQDPAQELGDTEYAQTRKVAHMTDVDVIENLTQAAVDNDFGENRGLQRHIGRIGTKNMRQYVDTDYYSYDKVNERGAEHVRKNPRRHDG